MILEIFSCNQNLFLTIFLFLMIFSVLLLQKIKKNVSRAQKIFKLFLHVDYIFPSMYTKNLVKIQRIEFFKGGCDNSSMRYVSSWHSCNVFKTSLGGRCLAAHQQPRLGQGFPPVPPAPLAWCGGSVGNGRYHWSDRRRSVRWSVRWPPVRVARCGKNREVGKNWNGMVPSM